MRGSIPAADKVYAVSRALGVSFEWLVVGEGEPHGETAAEPPSIHGVSRKRGIAAEAPAHYGKENHLDPMDRFWLDVTRKFERETYPPEDREMLRLMIFRLLYNAHIPIHEFWKRYNPRPEGVEIFEQKWKSDLDDFFKTMMKLKER